MIKDLTLQDFQNSDLAKRYEYIDNTIPENIIPNINELLEFLNFMQILLNKQLIIRLGYTSDELLKYLYDENSHKNGYTVDIYISGLFSTIKKFMNLYLKDKKFDECRIDSDMRRSWIHFSLKGENGQQRKILNLN